MDANGRIARSINDQAARELPNQIRGAESSLKILLVITWHWLRPAEAIFRETRVRTSPIRSLVEGKVAKARSCPEARN